MARSVGRDGTLVGAPLFPVHSFRQNWKQREQPQSHESSHRLETALYRIKKAQYLFYKHVVLHGVNLAVALPPPPQLDTTSTEDGPLVTQRSWRIFWLCLNAAYAMEFFLQSLVRRHVLRQSTMLWLNRLLMAVSSAAAVPAILRTVRWELCLTSLVLNLYHRHHDVFNTMGLASVAFCRLRRPVAEGSWQQSMAQNPKLLLVNYVCEPVMRLLPNRRIRGEGIEAMTIDLHFT
jgi:hypothetical protein